MSNFSQDSRQLGAENMPPTAFRVQADDDATVSSSEVYPSAVKASRDAVESRPPGTVVDIEAKSVASGSAEGLSGSTAEVNKVCAPRVPVLPATKLDHEFSELYNEIKQRIAHRTCLPDDGSALAAFWAISTWFREVLEVFPLLVISGPAHVAFRVLNVLEELCCQPDLLADFRRGDLKNLRGGTLLISANLDNRSVALLGNLTNRRFLLVEGRDVLGCAGSTAIYLGEDSPIKKIPHSIHIHAAPALAHGALAHRPAQKKIDDLRVRIHRYSTRHLARVRSLDFNPRGLSSELTVIANSLGSCIVGAPQLQTQLVALLKPQALQRIADRSESDEALVLRAALALCSHKDKGELYVKEITAEVNRLLVLRGETRQLSPEKVGHKLKKVGLFTRRLSQAGNGLTLDQPTRKRLRQVAAAYLGEDLIEEDENSHCPLREENELLMEDMEDLPPYLGEDLIQEDENSHRPLHEENELLTEVMEDMKDLPF